MPVLGLKNVFITDTYIVLARFSRGSCGAIKNTAKPDLVTLPGVSMTFWKKLYFGVALVGAVFLAVSLF